MTYRSAKRTEFLSDVMITAIEGGMDYWVEILELNRVEDSNEYLGWRWDGMVIKADDEPEIYTVNLNDVARGVRLLCESKIDNDRVNAMRLANKTNGDDGGIDAMNADMAIQYAIFGEIVYG